MGIGLGGRVGRGQCKSRSVRLCGSGVGWGQSLEKGKRGQHELQGQEETESGVLLLCLVRQVLGVAALCGALVPRQSLHWSWLLFKYFSCWQGP